MQKLVSFFQVVNLTLRWKLLGGFLLVNAVLLIALALAFVAISGNVGTIKNLQNSQVRVNQLATIELDQNKLVNSALDYMWSKNTDRLIVYEASRVKLNKEFAAFQPGAAQQATYDELKREIGVTVVTLDQMITYRDTGRSIEADNLWRTSGTQQIERSTRLVANLTKAETEFVQAENKQVIEQVNATTLLIGSLVILSLLIAIGLALLLTQAFTQPIKLLQQRLNQVAEGNLTHQIRVVNRDELGQLGYTYNSMVTSLQELIKQLFLQSQQVSTATEELTAQARMQVAGSSQQASAVGETTLALQELNQAAQTIAEQSLAVAQAVEHSLAQAQAVNNLSDVMVTAQQQGSHTVARTIEAIYGLKNQMEAIENQQQDLVVQSTTIQRVIKLIDGIAKETHLLSLNAAIEAAGAGTYGGRFKEVAQAVRHLANRVITETSEVRLALQGIAQSVAQSSQIVAQGLQVAEQAVREAQESDNTLRSLTALSEQVKTAVSQIETYIQTSVGLANQIGSTTYEQQNASELMLQTMLEIKAVTEQTLSSIKQGESATAQLGLTAHQLRARASAFALAA